MSSPFPSLVRVYNYEKRTSFYRMKCTFQKKMFFIVDFVKRTIVTYSFVSGNKWSGVSAGFNVKIMWADPQSRQRLLVTFIPDIQDIRLYSIIFFNFAVNLKFRKRAKFTMPIINIFFVPLLTKCKFKLSQVFLRRVLYLGDIKIVFWEQNTYFFMQGRLLIRWIFAHSHNRNTM